MTAPSSSSIPAQSADTNVDTVARERAFWNDRAREATSQLDPAVYAVNKASRFDSAMPWLPYLGVPALTEQLLQVIGDPAGGTILDLGCGSGFLSVLLARLCAKKVIGIDVSDEQLNIARFRAKASGIPGDSDRLEFRHASADRLDFPDATFDAVVGAFVLHHVDLPKTAAEIRRVLKPGGVGAFIETSARNPLLMAARSMLVGRFGMPKHGSADERPLGREQEELLSRTFDGSFAVHTPVLVNARMAAAYVAPLRWKPLAALLQASDAVIGTIIPPARRWSYYNVVEFQKK